MSQKSIDEILKRFNELSADERAELLIRLEYRQDAQPNGTAPAKSLLESFQARGLVGSIKGATADWSTNPDYLAGFGKPSDAQ